MVLFDVVHKHVHLRPGLCAIAGQRQFLRQEFRGGEHSADSGVVPLEKGEGQRGVLLVCREKCTYLFIQE